MNEKLNELNCMKKSLDPEFQKNERLALFQKIAAWTDTLARFDKRIGLNNKVNLTPFKTNPDD
jgi:hypothetical protein